MGIQWPSKSPSESPRNAKAAIADGTLAAEDEPTVGADVLPVSESAIAGAEGFDVSEAAAVAGIELMEVIEKALLQRSLRVMRQARLVLQMVHPSKSGSNTCLSIAGRNWHSILTGTLQDGTCIQTFKRKENLCWQAGLLENEARNPVPLVAERPVEKPSFEVRFDMKS